MHYDKITKCNNKILVHNSIVYIHNNIVYIGYLPVYILFTIYFFIKLKSYLYKIIMRALLIHEQNRFLTIQIQLCINSVI